jgi:hypothetical protein
VQAHQEGMVLVEATLSSPRSAGGSSSRRRRLASSASTAGSRSPATIASSIARPETPVMSVATEESLIPASSSSFSRRWTSLARSRTIAVRVRVRSRSWRIGSGGTNAPANEAVCAELSQPLGVVDVGLATRHALDVPGVDEHHLEGTVLEQVDRRASSSRSSLPSRRGSPPLRPGAREGPGSGSSSSPTSSPSRSREHVLALGFGRRPWRLAWKRRVRHTLHAPLPCVHLSRVPGGCQVSDPGRARQNQKSDARAHRQQSTVLVAALHRHADLTGSLAPTGVSASNRTAPRPAASVANISSSYGRSACGGATDPRQQRRVSRRPRAPRRRRTGRTTGRQPWLRCR